jgi:hypothetical protein
VYLLDQTTRGRVLAGRLRHSGGDSQRRHQQLQVVIRTWLGLLEQLDGAEEDLAGAAGLALVPQHRRQPAQRLTLAHQVALGGEAGDRFLVGVGRLGHPASLERRPGDTCQHLARSSHPARALGGRRRRPAPTHSAQIGLARLWQTAAAGLPASDRPGTYPA